MVTAHDMAEIKKIDTGEAMDQQDESKTAQIVQDRSDDVKKIEDLFAEGYKLFIGQDFEGAAEKLALATELSVDIYGQFAVQGYKLHYYYGRTLVEIARMESMVIKPPEDEDDDDEELLETTNTESEPVADETLKTENAEEIDDDEVSTDKLAWESLEVARKICEKQGDSAHWLQNKADVLVALGDCMTVGENFDSALDELRSALAIQEKILDPHDRRISETHYHIGITCKNKDDFIQAAEAFEKAAEVLQKAIEHFEKKKTENAEADPAEELAELKKILAEVHESVQDARDSAESRKKQFEQQKIIVTKLFTDALQTGEDLSATDITAMVRKSVKRPATSSDQTMTTLTTTKATAGEASALELIVTECISTTDDVSENCRKETDIKEPSGKKSKLDNSEPDA